ncbi:uncharacterized protein G2W53_032473 [Senna tora]|uniref:Uncharacterized protein n=1 Tax=Senna tora TaxID=362788 RepID=A0A834SYD1_9FABA|nr:uncharacterized protein G2W53_032473 [Senna tora]
METREKSEETREKKHCIRTQDLGQLDHFTSHSLSKVENQSICENTEAIVIVAKTSITVVETSVAVAIFEISVPVIVATVQVTFGFSSLSSRVVSFYFLASIWLAVNYE